MNTTPSTDTLRSAEETARQDLINLVDQFQELSGMADSTVSRAVYGVNGDKDFVAGLRKGERFTADKASKLEAFLRQGLAKKGKAADEFIQQAWVKARERSRRTDHQAAAL